MNIIKKFKKAYTEKELEMVRLKLCDVRLKSKGYHLEIKMHQKRLEYLQAKEEYLMHRIANEK